LFFPADERPQTEAFRAESVYGLDLRKRVAELKFMLSNTLSFKRWSRLLASYLLVLSANAFGELNADSNGTHSGDGLAGIRELVTTHHRITIGGREIAYTAKTGLLTLKDHREGSDRADIFFVAYVKDGVEPENRPLTFSFNGGPGSSSVWLHMGLLGPRRVLLDDDGFALPPPHRLVDNEFSLLDESDLVFIDPVSTGFSRATDAEMEKTFHGLNEDVEAVGDFIRRYVTEFERWPSPKFLIGESYGTTRAAALSLHLQQRHGMYLNGIMLVSAVLDFATIRYSEDNDLPFILFLPSMAATAWFHKRLGPDLLALALPELLKEAETFASGPYRAALFAGDSLPDNERAAVAARLAALTGLDKEAVLRHHLKPTVFDFFGALREDEGLRVGRFDGRYVGIAPLPFQSGRGGIHFDPSYAQIFGAYSATLNDYIRRELNFKTYLPYEILTNVWPWNFGDEFSTRYVNVAPRLRDAMVMNPFLRVHVCSGYYDLATPYWAMDYTLDRMFLHPSLRNNVEVAYYEAGHMMYTVLSELERQKQNLARFVRSASNQER
jgi:carboxypeptidase C (cathepsin A)